MLQMNLMAADDQCARNRCPVTTEVTRENGNFSTLFEQILRPARQHCELRFRSHYCLRQFLHPEKKKSKCQVKKMIFHQLGTRSCI